MSPQPSYDEMGELKRRVQKLEEAVAALQAVSQVGAGFLERRAPRAVFFR